MQRQEDNGWLRWGAALTLVALAHFGAWYGYTHLKDDIVPPRPLPAVYVSLLAPPEPPKVAPQPPQPPKPETKPQSKPRPAPQPRPLPAPAPAKEAVHQTEPQTELPVVAPSPPVPAVAAAPAPAPEPVYEAPRFNAAYLNNPPPPYPLMARRRGIEGTVLVRAEIKTDGACNRVELRRGSGSEALDQAALEAVKKWRFVPARKGTQTVVAWVDIPITFKLEN